MKNNMTELLLCERRDRTGPMNASIPPMKVADVDDLELSMTFQKKLLDRVGRGIALTKKRLVDTELLLNLEPNADDEEMLKHWTKSVNTMLTKKTNMNFPTLRSVRRDRDVARARAATSGTGTGSRPTAKLQRQHSVVLDQNMRHLREMVLNKNGKFGAAESGEALRTIPKYRGINCFENGSRTLVRKAGNYFGDYTEDSLPSWFGPQYYTVENQSPRASQHQLAFRTLGRDAAKLGIEQRDVIFRRRREVRESASREKSAAMNRSTSSAAESRAFLEDLRMSQCEAGDESDHFDESDNACDADLSMPPLHTGQDDDDESFHTQLYSLQDLNRQNDLHIQQQQQSETDCMQRGPVLAADESEQHLDGPIHLSLQSLDSVSSIMSPDIAMTSAIERPSGDVGQPHSQSGAPLRKMPSNMTMSSYKSMTSSTSQSKSKLKKSKQYIPPARLNPLHEQRRFELELLSTEDRRQQKRWQVRDFTRGALENQLPLQLHAFHDQLDSSVASAHKDDTSSVHSKMSSAQSSVHSGAHHGHSSQNSHVPAHAISPLPAGLGSPLPIQFTGSPYPSTQQSMQLTPLQLSKAWSLAAEAQKLGQKYNSPLFFMKPEHYVPPQALVPVRKSNVATLIPMVGGDHRAQLASARGESSVMPSSRSQTSRSTALLHPIPSLESTLSLSDEGLEHGSDVHTSPLALQEESQSTLVGHSLLEASASSSKVLDLLDSQSLNTAVKHWRRTHDVMAVPARITSRQREAFLREHPERVVTDQISLHGLLLDKNPLEEITRKNPNFDVDSF